MNKDHKILIELEKIQDPYSGLGQFCKNLTDKLLVNEQNSNIFYPYLPEKKFKLFSNFKSKLISLNKIHRNFSFLMPKCDLWHGTHQDTRYVPRKNATKFILTIHDLNFLHEGIYKKNQIKRLRLNLQKKINRADALTFISNFTKNEVLKEFKTDPTKPQVVIYNGMSKPAGTSQRPKIDLTSKFFFTIGAILPKKNFHVLIELIENLKDFNLVIAGSKFHPYANEIEELIKKKKLQNKIFLPGTITEFEKKWLFEHCEGLLFPSTLEGFGIPVIEAMSFGKPVFISKLTSLPEIGGKEAYYFDNFNSKHMESIVLYGMKDYSNNPNKEQQLRNIASKFSWETAADQYWKLYRQLL